MKHLEELRQSLREGICSDQGCSIKVSITINIGFALDMTILTRRYHAAHEYLDCRFGFALLRFLQLRLTLLDYVKCKIGGFGFGRIRV